jgi:hypothetical protein
MEREIGERKKESTRYAEDAGEAAEEGEERDEVGEA